MHTLRLFLYACLLSLLAACSESSPAAPVNLTISEGFTDPVGFYDPTPTFSWQLPTGDSVVQTAYEIEVEDLDGQTTITSGKTMSPNNIGLDLPALHPRSRQKMKWRVRFWNPADEVSDWSAYANVEYGLLENTDWRGEWVGGPLPTEQTKWDNQPRHHPLEFKKEFTVDEDLTNSRLYITAKGVFTAYLNGKRIGEDVMTPGWTPYHDRIETLTYDVSDLLRSGENTLTVKLAEGWYAGRLGYTPSQWINNTVAPRLLAQLENDGNVVAKSDASWQYRPDPLLQYASIYDGAEADASVEATAYQPVETDALDANVALKPKRHAPVKNMQTIPTKTLLKSSPEYTIFDLGQNMVGVPQLTLPLNAGDTLKVRFSEMLDLDGEMYTENYRAARSEDYYVAGEDGQIDWTPDFVFHGFRYVELSGYPADATPATSWVTGVVQHSDFDFTGNFTSSHPKLNQLQQNIEWGLRGNFLDIPTDCPQRDERLGWTGDAQVFAPTALFLTNTHAFWASWLESMRADQREDGGIPYFVPNLNVTKSSAGWGDAATIIPWELYFRTGDVSVLRENYDMMRAWVGYYEKQVSDGNYLVEFTSFNDWLQPYPQNGDRKGDTPQEFICTAYFARSADLCGRAAQVLGKVEEAKKLAGIRDAAREALRQAYFDADGQITEDRGTQTAYLLALGFDLLPPAMAQKAVPHLLAEIEAADGHLRTGFLGTPLLAPVLDRYGHADVAYNILFRETYPGWFYSINQGATTMWERWNSYTKADGFNAEGMNSFNHYAYGAIGQWLYERVAGIAPRTAGYREINFAPVIRQQLTSAAATHKSPYGKIVSDWSVAGDVLTWKISIPANTTGFVSLPAGFEAITSLERNGNGLEASPENSFELGPGDYVLVAE